MYHFENLYNIDTQEQVAVHMCCYDGVGGEIERAQVEVRVRKPINGKATAKDEITGEMIKGGGLDLEAM